jgi:hypothetical protein
VAQRCRKLCIVEERGFEHEGGIWVPADPERGVDCGGGAGEACEGAGEEEWGADYWACYCRLSLGVSGLGIREGKYLFPF